MTSRYLATVRRAISMPSPSSTSTILSSERTRRGDSASINCLIRCFTASEECGYLPADAELIAEVKKYLSSKVPRWVCMYLFEVTRLTVDS